MPNYSPSTISRVADLVVGLRVDRGATAIAAISNKSLFTVAGGNVLVLNIVGEVTTLVQNQADNAKFVSTPTAGSAVDLCAVSSIQAHEVGGLIGIAGAAATAMVKANAGAMIWATTPVVVAPGVIGIDTAADNTGAYKFSIWYVPLEDGAYITAA